MLFGLVAAGWADRLLQQRFPLTIQSTPAKLQSVRCFDLAESDDESLELQLRRIATISQRTIHRPANRSTEAHFNLHRIERHLHSWRQPAHRRVIVQLVARVR